MVTSLRYRSDAEIAKWVELALAGIVRVKVLRALGASGESALAAYLADNGRYRERFRDLAEVTRLLEARADQICAEVMHRKIG